MIALDAMVFAAGLGTRLGAIGQATPKALLEVGGTTMLERTVRRVAEAGADRVVVNVHHQAERIERFLAEHDLGVETRVSREPERPLETGGGLWHARAHFRGDRPILLHNVDVITDADLGALAASHHRSGMIATLAVNRRESARGLLFDDDGLCGRADRRPGMQRTDARPARGLVYEYAFAGIHVIAPRLIDRIAERGVFPIVDVYLRLAREGERLAPWLLGDARWLEIGSAQRLEAARAALGGSPRADHA